MDSDHHDFDSATQAAREQDYRMSSGCTSDDDLGKLHMFFSPAMIPAGLTDEEVRVCIEMYPRKEKISTRLFEESVQNFFSSLMSRFDEDYLFLDQCREVLSRALGEGVLRFRPEEVADLMSLTGNLVRHPFPFPEELRLNPMTRESFSLGMQKLIASIDELEK